MERLVEALRLVHGALIYDNSDFKSELLLKIYRNTIEENFVEESKPFHGRIAAIVGEAFDLSVDAVFQAAKPPRP